MASYIRTLIERKMLAISRALLGNPHLLMLDKPIEGVRDDPKLVRLLAP